MSWLARSIANTLMLDDDDGDDVDAAGGGRRSEESPPERSSGGGDESREVEPLTPKRGVKDDISDLTKTLSRHLWGVASFLAPPPDADSSSSSRPSGHPYPTGAGEEAPPDSPRIAGIRSDFAEIGGKMRSGISMLSGNKAVSEISKLASSLLPFGTERDDEGDYEEEEMDFGDSGAAGITEEVVAFVTSISMHPKTWLDFPLISEDEDGDDFDMSDAQQEHALAVQQLAPSLVALRTELCPSHMSEGCFWKIYFVLLHPKLNKHDAELLSTSKIVEARAMLSNNLESTEKGIPERFGEDVSGRKEITFVPTEEYAETPSDNLLTTYPRIVALEEPATSFNLNEVETEKHPVVTIESEIVDKSVVEEEPVTQAKKKDISIDASNIATQRYEDEGDDWLEEDAGEIGGSSSRVNTIPLANEDDVSFSDLEDEDDQDVPTSSRMVSDPHLSQPKDSRSWVQLDKTSGGSTEGSNSTKHTKDASDWLNVDDIDVV